MVVHEAFGMAVACNMDQVAMIQRSGCSNPCLILIDRCGSGDRLGVVEAEEAVGREDLGENGYGLIECAGSEHAPWRFGRTVVARPSILWWFGCLSAVFAANQVESGRFEFERLTLKTLAKVASGRK